mgnify:CR=1 FL=1
MTCHFCYARPTANNSSNAIRSGVAFTFLRVVLGVAISFALGILLAFFASRSAFLEQLLRPVVAAAKATPVMSIIMLALVWFTSSFVPIFSCVLLCFPIFYTNTLAGLKSVDKQLLEMASVFRVSHRRVITGIIVPSVIPHIYSALAVCLGFAWKSVVAAEVLSSPKYSLGYELYKTKLYLETPELFAWTIAIVLISQAFEKGALAALRRCRVGQPRRKGGARDGDARGGQILACLAEVEQRAVACELLATQRDLGVQGVPFRRHGRCALGAERAAFATGFVLRGERGFDLAHAVEIAGRGANRRHRLFRYPAAPCPRLANRLLDVEPPVDLGPITPNRAHLRQRIPIDHAGTPFIGGLPSEQTAGSSRQVYVLVRLTRQTNEPALVPRSSE